MIEGLLECESIPGAFAYLGKCGKLYRITEKAKESGNAGRLPDAAKAERGKRNYGRKNYHGGYRQDGGRNKKHCIPVL